MVKSYDSPVIAAVNANSKKTFLVFIASLIPELSAKLGIILLGRYFCKKK